MTDIIEVKIIRLYKKEDGSLFDVIKYEGDKPPYDKDKYTEIAPPFNINLKPIDKKYTTLSFVDGVWVETNDTGTQLKDIINKVYTVRNSYMYQNIPYLNQVCVVNPQSQAKVANVLFTATQMGKEDTDIVVSGWDCVDGTIEDMTVGQLKDLGLLMFEQEQKARAVARLLGTQYKTFTYEQLSEVDVEEDFAILFNDA